MVVSLTLYWHSLLLALLVLMWTSHSWPAVAAPLSSPKRLFLLMAMVEVWPVALLMKVASMLTVLSFECRFTSKVSSSLWLLGE